MPSSGSAATTRAVIGAYWQQDAGAVARRGDHVVLGPALRGDELDAGGGEQLALQLDVGEIVVGEQDLGHGGRGRRIADAQPYLVAGDRSSGLDQLRSPGERRRARAAPLGRAAGHPRDAAIIAGSPTSRTCAHRRQSPTRIPEQPMTKLLQTTIAGSLPKPALARRARRSCGRRGCSKATALAEGKRDAVRLVLRDQERAGIDIVTDGEQTRRHFVTTFIEGLDGVDFEHKKTVRIRNRYDADVPMVVGPVARRHPIYVDDAALPARRDRPPGQVHAARPDDDGRHALRRALPQPREAGAGRSPKS